MEHFVDKLDHDRRLSLRHNVRTDLRLRVRKFDAPEQRAHSENLSQRGVFFTTELPLNKGASLDLLVEMPEQVTGVPPGDVELDVAELCLRLDRPGAWLRLHVTVRDPPPGFATGACLPCVEARPAKQDDGILWRLCTWRTLRGLDDGRLGPADVMLPPARRGRPGAKLLGGKACEQ